MQAGETIKATIAVMFIWTGKVFFMAGAGYSIISGCYYLIKGRFLKMDFYQFINELGVTYISSLEKVSVTGLVGLDRLINNFIVFAPFWQASFICGTICFIIGYSLIANELNK